MTMARRTYVPEELAPEARELLVAFMHWASQPRQERLLADGNWTWPMMIDAFLMECGANGELEAPMPETGLPEAD